MLHYLHWKTRLVPPRVRKVQIAPEVTSDKRWKPLKENINSLFKKIRSGEDLSPYLSKKAHKNGYTPVQRVKDGDVDSWEDKDQILNTKGFHHFHLDMNIQSSGLSKRTDDVLFACITRDNFHAIALFNHSVFESANKTGSMTSERSRMWKIHEKYTTLGMAPGGAYISNPIMTSGHPLYLVRMSGFYSHLIFENDSQLNERAFVNKIYDECNLSHPSKFDFEWYIDGLDLGFFDKKNNEYFSLHQGYI